MSHKAENKVVFHEGYLQKGGILGSPTTPRPNIEVQGMGGNTNTSGNGNQNCNGKQVNINKSK